MGTRVWAFAPFGVTGAVALSFLLLGACDGAPSATPARAHASIDRRLSDAVPDGDGSSRPRLTSTAYGSAANDRHDAAAQAPAPLYKGKPIWAANKKHSAQENADYHFQRDGQAVEAKTEDDFIAKVHAFIDNPPKGVETLTRSNGDKLMYDPKANLFAVADRDGVPRTLFKPNDGAAYWDKQKDSLARGDEDSGSDRKPRRRTARRSDRDDNG